MFRRLYLGLRSPTISTTCVHSRRHFGASARVSSDIHSEILNILRENSENAASDDPAPETPSKKKPILILSPEQTGNKEYRRYLDTLKKRGSKAKKAPGKRSQTINLLPEVAVQEELLEDVSRAIENFKPESSSQIAKLSVKSAVQNLTSSFTKAQLASYIQQHGKALYRASHTKKKYADVIVKQIWGETANSASAVNAVLVSEHVPLTHQEMFLLLAHRGAILRILKSAVASLDFDTKKRELIIIGTEKQVENAKINLAHRFENAVREEIDLHTIQALYTEKFGRFTIEEIGKLIEVYFQHLNGDTYELCALNETQVKRTKRLLVWLLNYNLHTKQSLFLPHPDTLEKSSLVPYADEYSMAWKDRSKAHFQLLNEERHGQKDGTFEDISIKDAPLAREIERFSDEKLKTLVDTANFEVPREYFTDLCDYDETYEALQKAGLYGESEDVRDVVQDIVTKSKESASTENPDFVDTKIGNSLITESQKSQIYKELIDSGYRQNLLGLEGKSLDEPIFTATLGRVLFQTEKTRTSVVSVPPEKDNLSSAYMFNTNIPQVYDKMLRESFYEDVAGGEFDDPHNYSLQFKFLPSPYLEVPELPKNTKANSSKSAKAVDPNAQMMQNMHYPPIEIWMPLNENKVVDIESMQIVTVEGENNSFVCLPQCGSDLKITCQMTGRVIDDVAESSTEESVSQNEPSETVHEKEQDSATAGSEGTAETANSLSGLFESTSSKYPRLRTQTGVQKFIAESKLDFSGKSPTSIAPFVDIVLNGKTVRYAFISANYRRELDVEIGENQLVQVSIVDGGSLGGRRAECRFVGDFRGGMDRQAFDELVDSTCRFVEEL